MESCKLGVLGYTKWKETELTPLRTPTAFVIIERKHTEKVKVTGFRTIENEAPTTQMIELDTGQTKRMIGQEEVPAEIIIGTRHSIVVPTDSSIQIDMVQTVDIPTTHIMAMEDTKTIENVLLTGEMLKGMILEIAATTISFFADFGTSEVGAVTVIQKNILFVYPL